MITVCSWSKQQCYHNSISFNDLEFLEMTNADEIRATAVKLINFIDSNMFILKTFLTSLFQLTLRSHFILRFNSSNSHVSFRVCNVHFSNWFSFKITLKFLEYDITEITEA